ncbi:hypothetical protein CIG75_06570 [Tumebacillus algifaecis]|uniref:Sporulation protein n=1 Tax=Tumebacillus algifaecis TaxID=1214604 RepID=A0A223CZZ8_9BACL|nr:hypothetical protein [Tumebacillus algifaecis]ASS74666.1 hypothetical protein CIG75_06570 [Tumebacillus algifaecis]
MKKFTALVTALLLCATLGTACGKKADNAQFNGKPIDGGASAQSQQARNQGIQNGQPNVLYKQDHQQGMYEDQALEAALLQVQNVKHATVMVAGRDAYVMVEDTGSINKSDVGAPNTTDNILNAPAEVRLTAAMKNDIRDRLLLTNPNLRRVIILNQ